MIQENKISRIKNTSLEKEEEGRKVFSQDKEILEMLEAGVHFGHKKSKRNPKMKKFLYGTKTSIDIIDITKTREYLKQACDFLREKKKEGALILLVGTKISAKDLIQKLGEKTGMPYVSEKWFGGIITNFPQVQKQLEHLQELEESRAKGDFKNLSKKEILRIDQNIAKMKRKFGGLKNLKRLPDVLFVVDVKTEKLAIKEAKKENIPVVGICDTDSDPTSVDFAIPANDESITSLTYILSEVEKALQ